MMFYELTRNFTFVKIISHFIQPILWEIK